MDETQLSKTLSFGFEQTFTTPDWWTDEGFTATSDTPMKRKKMIEMAQAIADELGGSFKESLDIWKHIQYETFDAKGNPSFVVTMDPGSIEVKTQPLHIDQLESAMIPLFKAAEKADVVPYRNWWYGVKGGTEGGCHVNMGGLTDETNPLKSYPELVVKYCAYLHNRPWLHYPFMGIDVGPEGNSQRMDEQKDFEKSQKALRDFSNLYLNPKSENYQAQRHDPSLVYSHFKDTPLIKEKASFPSLFKFRDPLYLIEDRAQEALRNPHEFYLVAKMRLKIISELMSQQAVEELNSFDNLHQDLLTSFWLWSEFQKWSQAMKLETQAYKAFFDRQFPLLEMGENKPKLFAIKEGRRPRVITDIVKRGDTIVSKKIDTSYKRFEIFYPDTTSRYDFKFEAQGIESISPLYTIEATYRYIDIKINSENPQLKIELFHNSTNEVVEKACFDMNSMMWV